MVRVSIILSGLIESPRILLIAIAWYPTWTLEVQSRKCLILVGFMEKGAFDQGLWTGGEKLENGGWGIL